MGKIKQDEYWNKPARIMELVSTLYYSTASKLYYGLLKEHGNSFFYVILANLSVHKENIVFLTSLNDPANHPLDNDIITSDLLAVYIRIHQNDLPGSNMAETGKYPPTNETMMVVQPTLCEWKASQ